MFILDSHCDTPSQIHRLRDLSLDNPYAHVDFPKLKRGGLDGVFFAIYVPASLDSQEAYVYANTLINQVDQSLKANSEIAIKTYSTKEAFKNKKNNKISIFLGLENGSAIGESFDLLNSFYNKGVRYLTLCHSSHNLICDSCAPNVPKWGGLSPFGSGLITEMNKLGMLVDVSHISDESFYDVIKLSKAPVVATHSCCRALANHPRNMTDDMIKALAKNGGVIQVNFYPVFLDDGFSIVLNESGLEKKSEFIEEAFINNPEDSAKREAWYKVLDELSALRRPSYKRIVDHIDHIVSLVGIDYVGLGSDFDGIAVTPYGMDDISQYPKIFLELENRGYSYEEIKKIVGGNFLRVLQEVESLRQ